MSRLDTLRHSFDELTLDALIVSHLPHIRWAVGFTGSNGLLLVSRTGATFVSDSRYQTQAGGEIGDRATVVIQQGPFGLSKGLAESGAVAGLKRVGFQSAYTSVDQLDALRSALGDGITLVPVKDLVEAAVAVKESAEIETIRQAAAITDRVFDQLCGLIKPGMSELEIAAEIAYRHMKGGASGNSFDSIVAAGDHGALPHARPTERRLKSGELVVLDFGCVYQGYCSDMTRTIALGPIPDDHRRGYDVVLEAQLKAVSAARAGMTGVELDGVARQHISSAGLGEYFGHGLGHGVGLEIHEAPRVSYVNSGVLPVGAAVTIEPGVYVPGAYGVRIEDIVVLRDGSADVLTHSPKELITL